jgi:cytochrome c peroxidase
MQGKGPRRLRRFGIARLARLALAWCVLGPVASAQLLPPFAPPENPITTEKSILGKILFWDEQLSSDNTVACGTCHQPRQGGADPAFTRTAGDDGRMNTPDDTWGSPGVLLSDSLGRYKPDPVYGFGRQITGRVATEFMAASYFTTLFWDGRAGTTFVDPLSGAQLIAAGGALESQLVEPPVSTAEMAHEGRDWKEIERKLKRVRPLALATDLPTDISDALAAHPTYPDLFTHAFGDSGITVGRIAFAIATYERSLAPLHTPWDSYITGNKAALTAGQERGFNLFMGKARCNLCHVPPLFADDKFHNIGVRPVDEDIGLKGVTGIDSDRGLFRTPTLRNVGLRRRWMHNGKFGDLNHVLDFYIRGGDHTDNLDPLMIPLNINAFEKFDIYDFMTNGLTDPDVRDEIKLYTRPKLRSEQAANPSLFGEDSAGDSGFVPQMIAHAAPNLGNRAFKLGVHGGLGGAVAFIALGSERSPPGTYVDGIPINVGTVPDPYIVWFTLNGAGPGGGWQTLLLPLTNDPILAGQDWFAQWFVEDAAAVGGWSATRGAQIVFQQ